MNRINWTPGNREILIGLYDAGQTDLQISEYFKAGTYAIAKQRSILGLVSKKMPKNIKRLGRGVIKEVSNKPFYAIFYRKDNLNHFSLVDNNSEQAAKDLARNIICKQGITEITILQPTTKLVMQKITEIKL